ncbi:pimeloyl-ACP methyl ester carboxylesterase [Methanomicrobium sp. W14]|uniref:alpha/beta fold hydrolase n=1 Tax=Methanomicrobium sp. W14 TaxID=2817839 RepID=UPI001AE86A30|nr:alpha/beta hydrolase [Methanomicrobium sp. W14]MBP2133494.1 pimeloyl-ACP methyl ester carboxylesterase [Methanomicrobium sp. W14]
MKWKPVLAISAAILFFCIFSCGCTSQPEINTTSQTQAAGEDVAVSIEDTPVQYMDMTGDMTGNLTLAYREFGVNNSKPLLLIEGFGQTMDGWNSTFLGILSKDYHVYIYDHRDMGESSETEGNFTVYQLADDAACLITGLGYDSMNIYGVSMGSTVSQQLLILHPDRINKAVLSSATYSPSIPETEKLHGLLKAASTDPDSSEGVVKEAIANLEYPGNLNDLSSIQKDVMLITGTDDDLTPQSVAVEIAGKINGSWLVRFKGIPHAGSQYAPVEYAKITNEFLEMNETPA